ncbi:MAG: hypothetical protein D4R65_06675 [Verrucomicrobiaceae bacterium]|nr:MAG: hypothetical protein D4R65_06675 [Verrucomicrobiaceae bacterium]
MLSGNPLCAGDTKTITPAEEDPFFNNWMNLTMGGVIINGSKAQFQHANPTNSPLYGGIQDMHIEKSLGKAQMTLDARAIFSNSDYKVKLDITLPDVGYIQGGFTEFCTYYNGNGGYLPPNDNLPNGRFYPGPEFALYRGLAWLEVGLRVPNFPELTFRYEHAFRAGQKDSTIWGGTQSSAAPSTAWPAPTVTPINPQTGRVTTNYPNTTSGYRSSVRKILPAFRNINEQRDTLAFDGKYLFGKPEAMGNTELNFGLRYDYINNSDSLNYQTAPGGASTVLGSSTAFNVFNIPQVPTNYYTTQTDSQKSASLNGHASTITRFGDKLWLTVGYGYTAVSSSISGERINGPEFGSPYSAYYNNLAYAGLNGGYVDLGGNAKMGQSVTTVNLMWMPIEGLTIIPAIRFENDNTLASSSRLTQISQTTNATGALLTPRAGRRAATTAYQLVSPATTVNQPTIVNSAVSLNEFNQSLDIRYSKLRNWVLYARGEWTEAYEDRQINTPHNSFNGLTQFKDWNSPAAYWQNPNIYNFNGSNSNIRQKYTLGANWYPMPQLSLAVQYYASLQNINQTIYSDDPTRVNPRYYFGSPQIPPQTTTKFSSTGAYSASTNQRLMNQFWFTNDVNFRATWQALPNLNLVTRFDFQRTQIDSQWELTSSMEEPNVFPAGQSGLVTTGIISESMTWNPLDRMYVQGNLSYVANTITSPAAGLSSAFTNSENNYWTASVGMGYALDNKTQINLDGSYYCATNYVNNSATGVPYGAGATEFDFSVGVTRQISRNIGISVKYYYNSYRDLLSGGNNSYTAQIISTNLQVMF